MSSQRALRPDPNRVLILTALRADRPSADRQLALLGLVEPLGAAVDVLELHERARDEDLVLRRSGGATPGGLEAAEAAGAIVVDGAAADLLSSEAMEHLARAVSRGASLLVLAAPAMTRGTRLSEWTGIEPAEEHRAGEWFAKVRPLEASGLTARVREEFAIEDQPVSLRATAGEAVPLVQLSVAFTDRFVVMARRIGEGRVVVSGLGGDPGALRNPELATILRRSLLPAGELSRRNRSIGVAVLGYGPYGGMGLYHGLAAEATPGLEMIAACDFDPARRKAAEEEFPGLRPYASVAELLADEDVQLVIVATPPSTHHELARGLLEAGKHVAVEKPMCLTVSEADDLIAQAESAHLALTVHQSRRFDPDYVALRRLVDSNGIGELFNVETFVGGFAHPCRAWHSETSISGGAVYDWGSHHLDWILQLMGDFPQRLVAHGHKRVWQDVTNLDQVRVRLAWADGREAEFLQSDVAGIRRPKFYLQGTAGTVAGHYRLMRRESVEAGIGYASEELHHAEAPVELTLVRYEPAYGLTETVLPPAPVERYAFHHNLADHLLLGEPLAVTPGSARQVVALLEAAQASTDAGNVPVDLSPPGI